MNKLASLPYILGSILGIPRGFITWGNCYILRRKNWC